MGESNLTLAGIIDGLENIDELLKELIKGIEGIKKIDNVDGLPRLDEKWNEIVTYVTSMLGDADRWNTGEEHIGRLKIELEKIIGYMRGRKILVEHDPTGKREDFLGNLEYLLDLFNSITEEINKERNERDRITTAQKRKHPNKTMMMEELRKKQEERMRQLESETIDMIYELSCLEHSSGELKGIKKIIRKLTENKGEMIYELLCLDDVERIIRSMKRAAEKKGEIDDKIENNNPQEAENAYVSCLLKRGNELFGNTDVLKDLIISKVIKEEAQDVGKQAEQPVEQAEQPVKQDVIFEIPETYFKRIIHMIREENPNEKINDISCFDIVNIEGERIVRIKGSVYIPREQKEKVEVEDEDGRNFYEIIREELSYKSIQVEASELLAKNVFLESLGGYKKGDQLNPLIKNIIKLGYRGRTLITSPEMQKLIDETSEIMNAEMIGEEVELEDMMDPDELAELQNEFVEEDIVALRRKMRGDTLPNEDALVDESVRRSWIKEIDRLMSRYIDCIRKMLTDQYAMINMQPSEIKQKLKQLRLLKELRKCQEKGDIDGFLQIIDQDTEPLKATIGEQIARVKALYAKYVIVKRIELVDEAGEKFRGKLQDAKQDENKQNDILRDMEKMMGERTIDKPDALLEFLLKYLLKSDRERRKYAKKQLKTYYKEMGIKGKVYWIRAEQIKQLVGFISKESLWTEDIEDEVKYRNKAQGMFKEQYIKNFKRILLVQAAEMLKSKNTQINNGETRKMAIEETVSQHERPTSPSDGRE